MKRFVIILLVLCLILGGAIGYVVAKNGGNGVVLPESGAAETPSDGEITVRTLDYEAIRALHEPDEIVGSVAGSDVSWEEYFYWLRSEGLEVEQQLQMLAYYGQSLGWDEKLSADSDLTLAGYVLEMAQSDCSQLHVIEAVAEENGVTLTEENEAKLRERQQQRLAERGCASEEEFNALLERDMVSRAMLDRVDRANFLYQNNFITLYGANGEKVPEETAIAYLRDNNYLCAAHILFSTVDLQSGELMDEETAAQKLQQAEAVAEELRSIEDPAERAKRFAELKEQYCEDTEGMSMFPDGYLFPAGVGAMADEFEACVKTLQENEISEPVKTVYGYHVILRLPLSATMTMQYSEAGTPLDARALYANEQYNAMMNSRFEAGVFEPRDGFSLDLTDYLK